MLKINLYRNNNNSSRSFGKVYARVENAQPIGIEELAQHMSEHNTPYSKGVIKGILTDMASCIKELMLMGQPVKLADLCIFKASVKSTGANSAAEYDISKNVKTIRLTAQATGEMSASKLLNDGQLCYTSLAQAVRSGKADIDGNAANSDDNTDNGDNTGTGDGEDSGTVVRP